jgi:hypothetical protein
MARGRPKSDKPKKRKKVTVQLIKEKHAGEVTEPYRLLQEIRDAEHGHLGDAKIGMAWRLGWRANTDGQLQLGACRKRGDLDRELDGFDFIILLNREAFAVLNEKSKRALIDHELTHAQIVNDSDGNPKHDDRDRLVCRIRKHDVEEFRVIVERHGAWTQNLAKMAQAAINDASRPLLKIAEAANDPPYNGDGTLTFFQESTGEGEGEGETAETPTAKPLTKKQWRKTPLAVVISNPRYTEALAAADIDTCGNLQDTMNKHGMLWNRTIKGIGDIAKVKIENAFNAYVSLHPEIVA